MKYIYKIKFFEPTIDLETGEYNYKNMVVNEILTLQTFERDDRYAEIRAQAYCEAFPYFNETEIVFSVIADDDTELEAFLVSKGKNIGNNSWKFFHPWKEEE